jgi:hypothetical protein
VVVSPTCNAPEKIKPAIAPPAIPAPATVAHTTVATRIRPRASVRRSVLRIRDHSIRSQDTGETAARPPEPRERHRELYEAEYAWQQHRLDKLRQSIRRKLENPPDAGGTR